VRLEPSYEGRLDQLGTLVEQAVRRRLIADVPLGAFLSGGVDSALVVSTMQQVGVTPTTFSVGFSDSPDSEHLAARAYAEHLGCDHHEILVRPDAIELASSIADSLDEPNGDSSCLPTRLLSEFARQHVTVALSGDGGDEMFGGYGRYFDVLSESNDPSRPEAWAPSDAYLGPRWTIFQAQQIEAFLGTRPKRLSELLGGWARELERPDRTLLQRMRNVDAGSYLPGSVLAKVDRMSMFHSLEVRCPLLDLDLARFAAALADDDCLYASPQVEGGRRVAGKRLLKDLLARRVPRDWVERPKVGFGLPEAFWDGSALRRFASDALDSPDTRLRDYMDARALSDWLATQQDPRFFSIYRLWPLLILELWLRGRKLP
jgi:asparagine synthase (glutamine-hydrolysing)